MKRVFLGNLVGLASIFLVNGAVFSIGKTFSASEIGVFWAGCIVAALVALRLWSSTGMPSRSSAWWLFVAFASALVGTFLFWLDIWLGYIVLPIPPGGGILDAIGNPMAVMISAAFLPFFVSIAIGCAVRVAFLKHFGNHV